MLKRVTGMLGLHFTLTVHLSGAKQRCFYKSIKFNETPIQLEFDWLNYENTKSRVFVNKSITY